METIKTKVCAKCGKEKSVEYFKKSGVSADGYCRLCNECTPPAKPKRLRVYEGGNSALAGFKPRELMDELRARGYHGELKITQSVKF